MAGWGTAETRTPPPPCLLAVSGQAAVLCQGSHPARVLHKLHLSFCLREVLKTSTGLGLSCLNPQGNRIVWASQAATCKASAQALSQAGRMDGC